MIIRSAASVAARWDSTSWDEARVEKAVLGARLLAITRNPAFSAQTSRPSRRLFRTAEGAASRSGAILPIPIPPLKPLMTDPVYLFDC